MLRIIETNNSLFKNPRSIYLKPLGSSRIATLPIYKPGKPVEELQRELGFEKAIKLASNENPLGPSLSTIKKIQEGASFSHIYPDGDCFELKRKISEKEKILPNQIILGNGSNEVLELISHAFLNPRDKAIMGEFCFIVYPIVTELSEGIIVRAKMEDLILDLNDVLEKIDHETKIIFIANPNNPTGGRSTKKEIEGFLDKVPKSVLVVIDEAYAEYMGGENLNVSQSITKHENLIILKTFSKAYGLAGLRVGYGMANDEIISLLNKPREPFNVNQLAQIGAIAALDDQKHVEDSIKLNKKGMSYLKTEFNKMNIKTYPSYANFILLEFNSEARIIYEELLKKGIIVRPLENYGLKNHLRVTVGLENDNVKLVEALKEIL